MAGKIKVGIAGCGMIARKSHIPGFASLKGVEVSALYDVDRGKAEDCGRSMLPEAKIFAGFREMLDSGIDAVSVCTPTVFHSTQSIAAFKKGLHVFCEKPIAGDIRNAARMVNCAGNAARVLHINMSLRYSPLYGRVAALIEQGIIGDFLHMRCIRAAAGNPAGPGGWSPGAKWFVSRNYGGGVLLDIGIHMADLFRWYGGDVAEIAGDVRNMEVEDGASESAVAVFRFKSGATGSLELKWNLGTGANMLEVYGRKGALRLGFREGGIECIPGGGKPSQPVVYAPYKRAKNSFGSFIGAIRGDAPSLTPGELGRDSLALCEAISKSSESGKFEKVKHWK